jgi:thiamine kinase-like enzyme
MRHLPQVLEDHPSTFTHGDLLRQNVIVQELSGTNGQPDRQLKVTGIVDWEMADWYPQYWEYASYFGENLWEGDWMDKFETFIKPWPLEAALFRLLQIDLDGF